MSGHSFQLPQGTPDEQLTRCLSIINSQREELLPLRQKVNTYHLRVFNLENIATHWREKYQKAEEELQKLKEKNKTLEKEKEILKTEIEKLTKSNNRYQIALFDHGNFKHTHGKKKKSKGGQTGHPDTNREAHEDYKTYGHKRVFAKTCGKCGSALSRANSIRSKILLDIIINPDIVKLIIESERQWCSMCHKEVSAKDPQTLPFTEYGINTFMISLILRFKSNASLGSIATVLHIGYGLPLSKSDVSSLLKMSATFLGKRYKQLKEAVRKGVVMYNDETGWLIHGQKAWMWIMATGDKKQSDGIVASGITVYVAAESRGKGIAEEMYGASQAFAMTDGLYSYLNTIPREKHLYCWSHVLRYAFEETVKLSKSHLSCSIRDRLVSLYQTIRKHPEWTQEQKKQKLRDELDRLIEVSSTDQTVRNIQYRIKTQKEGLIRALLVTADGTNNLAERELRNMAIKRTVSHGSDTYRGMETIAIIGSVLQTISRNKETPFLPTLQTCLAEGIQEKYPQYLHTPYYDS
jgi:hypothetical protein